ncbi:uncharacterized protein [Miscanthus floridulus]|uniref:uncharacterized protein n=1 Tax=Miscanthus floridulus TaxID=154761 RepID=UPI0034596084
MTDIWSLVQWWDDWQLRILVLGSLGLQWFLLLAAPMRKYTVPKAFRTCIWLAYISCDALAIYALATLFNRHARTVPASYCPAPTPAGGGPAGKEQSRILEVLWAPILLIHLGGQEELTAYEIEDNELWMRHTVTLVSQVSVAVYAFYKSWQPSSSDGGKLTAAAILLFVIGVISFSEKPFALNRAKIKRLAAVSALIQGTAQPSVWRKRLSQFSFKDPPEKEPVALSEGDKVLMVLSDMSLLAAAKDLVERKKAVKVEEVLPPLLIAEKGLAHWLRGAFAFIYTRASVVVTPLYLLYHLMLVPVLHVAALTLFAMSDKRGYKRADVKITYVVLCLTAALDFLAVFVRQLVYWLMSTTEVPALCETVPEYNLIDEAVREADKGVGWIYWCARKLGYTRTRHSEVYRKVAGNVLPDLVEAQDRDLASYRVFDEDYSTAETTKSKNWALSKELQEWCGEEIKASLGIPFDRSVLRWHIATDLCLRCIDVESDGDEEEEEIIGGGGEAAAGEGAAEGQEQGESAAVGSSSPDADADAQGQGQGQERRMDPALRLNIKCIGAISNYMAHLLNSNPEMLLTGSRHHLISEARDEVKSAILRNKVIKEGSDGCSFTKPLGQKDQVKKFISEIAGRRVNPYTTRPVFHIIAACKLANELLAMDDAKRWKLMYRVWLGMLCYSATMCRGYLHAKSLGEGGEFLSFVWLVLSLKGAQTLADKLQLPPETQASSHKKEASARASDDKLQREPEIVHSVT